MFQDNTVFVIGAGASAEFGFPVGWELMNTIKSNSFFRFGHMEEDKGDRALLHAMKRKYRELDELNARLRACAEINRAIDSAKSIDSFIYRNSHDPLIAEMGKVQIAYALSKAERSSMLFINPSSRLREGLDWESIDKTWISQFAYAMFDGVRTTEVDTVGNNITVICFNYDRSIELYLAHAIQRSFQNVSLETAHEIVGRINIIHPYGVLGKLPISPGGYGKGFVRYGANTDEVDLWEMAETLLTFSESISDEEIVGRIKHAMINARNIVFMGFAFARQNMELLSAAGNEIPPFHKKLYSTGFGIPKQVSDTVKTKIATLYSDRPIDHARACEFITVEHDLKCKPFLDTHVINLIQ